MYHTRASHCHLNLQLRHCELQLGLLCITTTLCKLSGLTAIPGWRWLKMAEVPSPSFTILHHPSAVHVPGLPRFPDGCLETEGSILKAPHCSLIVLETWINNKHCQCTSFRGCFVVFKLIWTAWNSPYCHQDSFNRSCFVFHVMTRPTSTVCDKDRQSVGKWNIHLLPSVDLYSECDLVLHNRVQMPRVLHNNNLETCIQLQSELA